MDVETSYFMHLTSTSYFMCVFICVCTQFKRALLGGAVLVELHQGVEVEQVHLGGDSLGLQGPTLASVEVGHGPRQPLSGLHLPVALHQEPAGENKRSEALDEVALLQEGG